jgi:hypothetical protein
LRIIKNVDKLILDAAINVGLEAVEGARKDAALKPSQKVTLTIDVPQEVQRVVEGARAELARVAGVGEVVYAIVGEESHTVSLGEHSARFSIAA